LQSLIYLKKLIDNYQICENQFITKITTDITENENKTVITLTLKYINSTIVVLYRAKNDLYTYHTTIDLVGIKFFSDIIPFINKINKRQDNINVNLSNKKVYFKSSHYLLNNSLDDIWVHITTIDSLKIIVDFFCRYQESATTIDAFLCLHKSADLLIDCMQIAISSYRCKYCKLEFSEDDFIKYKIITQACILKKYYELLIENNVNDDLRFKFIVEPESESWPHNNEYFKNLALAAQINCSLISGQIKVNLIMYVVDEYDKPLGSDLLIMRQILEIFGAYLNLGGGCAFVENNTLKWGLTFIIDNTQKHNLHHVTTYKHLLVNLVAAMSEIIYNNLPKLLLMLEKITPDVYTLLVDSDTNFKRINDKYFNFINKYSNVDNLKLDKYTNLNNHEILMTCGTLLDPIYKTTTITNLKQIRSFYSGNKTKLFLVNGDIENKTRYLILKIELTNEIYDDTIKRFYSDDQLYIKMNNRLNEYHDFRNYYYYGNNIKKDAALSDVQQFNNILNNTEKYRDILHLNKKNKNEIRIMKTLSKNYPEFPFIARYIEYNSMLFSYNYISLNLEKFNKTNNPNINLIIHWMREIAYSLLFLKIHDVVHVDLKPQNIVLNSNLEIKLIDFAEALIIKNQDNPIRCAVTVPFSAPETFNYITRYITCASDIFSYGQIFYTLLTKKYMNINMDGNKSDGILRKIYANGKYTFDEKIKEELYAMGPKYIMNNIFYLIENCCMKNPEDRPSHHAIIEMIEDIDNLFNNNFIY